MTYNTQPTPKPYVWTHEIVIGLSMPHCANCAGKGLLSKWRTLIPCKCVTRSIFRLVMNTYRIQERPVTLRSSLARLDCPSSGAINHPSHKGHVSAEFCADVESIARRALTPLQRVIFKQHYILGRKAQEVSRRVGLSRETGYWHEVERVEQIAGRAFCQTLPYPVFPIAEYFRGTDVPVDVRPFHVSERHSNGVPLRAPLLPKPEPPVPAVVEIPTKRTGLLCPRPGRHKKAACAVAPVRPPLAQPEQPVPLPVVPIIVPQQPVDPKAFARERFKAGVSTRAIAASLNVVAPNATHWYQSDIKRLLLAA
jgi:hypothetical protein